MNIEILSGSPRRGSLSHRVALHLHQHLGAVAPQHQTGLISMQTDGLPPIQEVWSSPDAAPEAYRPVAARMFSADAFLLVSPEYNGGYAPALKNFLDHFLKQARKPFGICTSSPGALGGIRCSQQLLLLVPALACPNLLIVPGVDKKFGADGQLLDEAFSKSIHDFTREFLWLAEAVHAAGK